MIRYPHFTLFDEVKKDDVPVPAGGGGTPAPSGPASSDVDWEGESDLREEAPAAPKPAAAPAAPASPAPSEPAAVVPTAPATPAPEPAPAPAAAPVQPAAPVAPAPAAAAPVAPAEPAPAAQPTPAPVDMAALRTAEVTRLTDSVYKMDETTARGMLVEPEKHLPAMLANMHVNIVDAVVQSIYSRLPEAVRSLTQVQRGVTEAENEFYKVWPQLREKPEYSKQVEDAIRAYRTLNPKAPRAEVIRAAGLTAMISLRLPLPKELFDAPVPVPAPAPGFVPAAPAAGGGVPQATRQPGAFELLNEEFDDEERR